MPTQSKTTKTANRSIALDTLYHTHGLYPGGPAGTTIYVCTFPGSYSGSGVWLNRYRLFILRTNPVDQTTYPIDITTLVRDACDLRWSSKFGYLMSHDTPGGIVYHLQSRMAAHIGKPIAYYSPTLF